MTRLRAALLSPTVRWNIVGVAVVLALVAALWPRTDSAPVPGSAGTQATQQQDPARLAEVAAAANLDPCPAADGPRSTGPLADLRLQCLAGGQTVDLATALGGRPAVLNLWAWWCGPCAKELPVMAEFAARAEPEVAVLTVHSDPNQLRGLQAMRDYGVHLASVQDSQQRLGALAGAPAAYPVTVLLRADGTVAQVLAVAFSSVDQVASAVDRWLGVQV
ncbi:TlpA disulfide reductase family protein [Rhodococcus sp. X156]|uniref:TlpA disulfide reductase family protein n=1 Tax=Rhodococcus sp. X156 TaxID=2499145 RepID=UPI000FDC0735|nr:TlpA disulfide reductase family protein [Rhodococcus sp. X156]